MFTALAVLASYAVLSQADVTPNNPGPGDSFNQGAQCAIGWAGDTNSTTAWLNMAIELMTGSNEQMVHITTVATGQDGTKDGKFTYTCPEVTPNSPIYFYQFTAPGTPDVQWTGRFTIAGADGSSTPATEHEQFDGQTVDFGTGALVDPSTAVGPPTFNSTSTGDNSTDTSSSASQSSSATLSTSRTSSVSSKATSSSASSSAPSVSGSSAAVPMGPMAVDARLWSVVAALTTSAMAFTLWL